MKVLVCDDEEQVIKAVVRKLQSMDFDAEGVTSVPDAEAWLSRCDEPLALVTDHDLMGEKSGYDLIEWMRKNHPFGLLIPVIYLTGKESERNFLQKLRQGLLIQPITLVAKDETVTDGELLPRLLRSYQNQFESIRTLAAEQSARQAVLDLATEA